jgi:hypothetical protein
VITCYVGLQIYADMFNGRPRLTWVDCHPLMAAFEKERLIGCGHKNFATNNPYFVDCFELHEVRIVVRDKNHVRWTAALSAHPDSLRMPGALSAGEFWSAVGEGWVLESPLKVEQ